MSCSSQACKLSVVYGLWMVVELNLLCRQAASFEAVVPVHDRIIHVFMCVLICCFNIPGVAFCLGYRWSALLFIHPALGTVNDPKCSDMKDCYSQTKQGAEKQFALLGQKQLDMLMLDYPADENCDSIRGQWKAFEDTVIEKNMLSCDGVEIVESPNINSCWLEKAIIFVVHIKVPNYPSTIQKTIQTSIRPFLWHDEQLYKFTPFNSKWIIYFHDILPISKRFKWNSYIDGNPRCLQLIFTRHRRSMLPNVFGVLLWDSWKQTNKQIIPQWELFLENWMFYWNIWNTILGMWHSDVFWVVWLSRNFW